MPHGATLEYLVAGEGDPTTVFAHGLGRRHPRHPAAGQWRGRPQGVLPVPRARPLRRARPTSIGYADLAADLRAVADEFGASRAVGVSLGAGALCRLLAQTPDRFDRVVFFLPAVLDEPRPAAAMARARALLEAVEADDAPAAAGLLVGGHPGRRCATGRPRGATCGSASTRCSRTGSPRGWPDCPSRPPCPTAAVLAVGQGPGAGDRLPRRCGPPAGRGRAAGRRAAQRDPAHLSTSRRCSGPTGPTCAPAISEFLERSLGLGSLWV